MEYGSLENFDRQYRCTITGPAGGFTFGGEKFPLHISFSIQKSDLSTPNSGSVSVWNLSPEHISMLIEGEGNARLELRAGYRDRLHHVFTGVVNFSSTAMDGADRRTDIEVIDLLENHRDPYVTESFAPGTNWKDITDAAAADIGATIEYSYNSEFKNIDTGFQFVGLAQDILTKACESNLLTWSVQDGVIQVKKDLNVMNLDQYVISAKTGMIELPVRTCLAGSDQTGDKVVGYDVTCLLNADIHVSDYVFLDSKVASGSFEVKSVEYIGDNHSGDWVTKMRLLEMK